MTKTTHRILTSIAYTLTGITGLLAATDPSGLGVPAHTWGFVCLAVSVVGLSIQGIRQAFDSPDAAAVPPTPPPGPTP